MRGLDYQSVVGRKPDPGSETTAYVLRLGSVELEPISYSTLLALRDCPVVVREVLDLCFLDRPVMWADPAEVPPGSYRARLREIEALLVAIDQRFKDASRPCHGVFARIVELWRELTLAALRDLERAVDPGAGVSARKVLIDLRRTVLPCVQALVELLPEDDECSIRARRKLVEGRAGLTEAMASEPAVFEDVGWRQTEIPRDPEDPGFVTWGIP
ncbi:MAG: hypothetical protein GY769_25055 [bacterium]|nr:hypothetical protein [bacterium]